MYTKTPKKKERQQRILTFSQAEHKHNAYIYDSITSEWARARAYAHIYTHLKNSNMNYFISAFHHTHKKIPEKK